MYHIRFNCMNLDDFNKKLILKRQPITKQEMYKAIADISLQQISFSCANHTQYEKSVEAIIGLIKYNDLLSVFIYQHQYDLNAYFLEDYCENLSVSQLVAINDYCDKQGYTSVEILLKSLKESGVFDENSPLEDLAEQVADDTYETMYNYLMGC